VRSHIVEQETLPVFSDFWLPKDFGAYLLHATKQDCPRIRLGMTERKCQTVITAVLEPDALGHSRAESDGGEGAADRVRGPQVAALLGGGSSNVVGWVQSRSNLPDAGVLGAVLIAEELERELRLSPRRGFDDLARRHGRKAKKLSRRRWVEPGWEDRWGLLWSDGRPLDHGPEDPPVLVAWSDTVGDDRLGTSPVQGADRDRPASRHLDRPGSR
jgi:hypothetical protein